MTLFEVVFCRSTKHCAVFIVTGINIPNMRNRDLSKSHINIQLGYKEMAHVSEVINTTHVTMVTSFVV